MEVTTLLGLLAGALTTLAYFPQVIKTWRSRSADGMSWSMLVILCVGVLLWLVYGVYVHDMPVILANVITLMLSSAILGMKIRFEAMPRRSSLQPSTGTSVASSLEAGFGSSFTLKQEIMLTASESEPSSPVA